MSCTNSSQEKFLFLHWKRSFCFRWYMCTWLSFVQTDNKTGNICFNLYLPEQKKTKCICFCSYSYIKWNPTKWMNEWCRAELQYSWKFRLFCQCIFGAISQNNRGKSQSFTLFESVIATTGSSITQRSNERIFEKCAFQWTRQFCWFSDSFFFPWRN